MEVPPADKSPGAAQMAEQLWAQAGEALDKVLAEVKRLEPQMTVQTGGNTDASIVFDFMKGYIRQAENEAIAAGVPQLARNATIMLAAAAITRLVRHDDRTEANDVLAQLQKDWDKA